MYVIGMKTYRAEMYCDETWLMKRDIIANPGLELAIVVQQSGPPVMPRMTTPLCKS